MLTRSDFPIFRNHNNLIYLDSAATSQLPQQIIDEQAEWYQKSNANPHRGLYNLSIWATSKFEDARQIISNIFEVKSSETVFVRNSTEGLNLIAQGFKNYLNPGDSIVISELEHHSNILPWMEIARETKSILKYINVKNGRINLKHAEEIIDKRTKIVSISHVSNVFGTIQPVKQISEISHKNNCVVIIDGAQAVAHLQVKPWELGADAYVFSGHKSYAPSGIGVLFLKDSLSQKIGHFLLGGEVVESVSYGDYKLKKSPWKFEAGSANTSGAVCLAKSLSLVDSDFNNNKIKLESIKSDIYKTLVSLNAKIYSPEDIDIPLVSFNFDRVKADQLAILLDNDEIAIRNGFLCAEPIVRKLNVDGVARISAGLWNEPSDIDNLKNVLKKII